MCDSGAYYLQTCLGNFVAFSLSWPCLKLAGAQLSLSWDESLDMQVANGEQRNSALTEWQLDSRPDPDTADQSINDGHCSLLFVGYKTQT
jgi:hypothetical protein